MAALLRMAEGIEAPLNESVALFSLGRILGRLEKMRSEFVLRGEAEHCLDEDLKVLIWASEMVAWHFREQGEGYAGEGGVGEAG